MQSFTVVVWCVFFLVLACPALAIMPPHLDGSVPEDGGMLESDIIRLEGYTLFRPGPGDLEIIDQDTGQSAAWEVVNLECTDEGDWARAEEDDGAIQFHCVLLIRLLTPEPGHQYILTFLDTSLRFTCKP